MILYTFITGVAELIYRDSKFIYTYLWLVICKGGNLCKMINKIIIRELSTFYRFDNGQYHLLSCRFFSINTSFTTFQLSTFIYI